MSISIGSSSSVYQTAYQSDPTKDQFKKYMQDIQTALQAGDMSAAQDAFNKLQELQQSKQDRNKSGSDVIQADMKALQSAFSSDNIQDAQSAFAKLQTDMKAQGTHHKHHKHDHHMDTSMQSAVPTTDAKTGDSLPKYA